MRVMFGRCRQPKPHVTNALRVRPRLQQVSRPAPDAWPAHQDPALTLSTCSAVVSAGVTIEPFDQDRHIVDTIGSLIAEGVPRGFPNSPCAARFRLYTRWDGSPRSAKTAF